VGSGWLEADSVSKDGREGLADGTLPELEDDFDERSRFLRTSAIESLAKSEFPKTGIHAKKSRVKRLFYAKVV
jgi:hypothetical protein